MVARSALNHLAAPGGQVLGPGRVLSGCREEKSALGSIKFRPASMGVCGGEPEALVLKSCLLGMLGRRLDSR